MQNLPVQGLNFDEIKQSFKDFIKDNPNYKDWNFESSGINTLLNLLAYNTHYIGYYVKMLLDESFVDSAHTREALLSHSKRTSYIPKGKKAARAEVILRVVVPTEQDSPSQTYHIESANSNFSAVNSQADRRIFSLTEDLVLYDRTVSGANVTYVSPTVTIFEGTLENYRFVVDPIELNQRFIIRDKDIDITTLKVDVEIDGLTEQYTLATDIFELNSQSKVFFVTTDENGFYQIFFGDDVFGIKPPGGSVLTCNYISTNGETGNGAKKFTFNLLGQNTGGSVIFNTETVSVSSGGMPAEDIESLKFSIPNHYRRQNRIHSEPDYRAVLLSEFRNIDSINVWGGEKNDQRSYGKVFVSIKPKFADSLTSASKNEIKNSIVLKYGSVGADVQFVDPSFIETDLEIFGKINPRLTNDPNKTIEAKVLTKIKEYNDTKLNRFGNIFSEVDFLSTLRDTDNSITTIYSTKKLRKNVTILHGSQSENIISFANPIKPGVSSNTIMFGGRNCKLIDIDNEIFLVDSATEQKLLPKSSGTIEFKQGLIKFSLPSSARVLGSESEKMAKVEFTVEPLLPDINTSLNNIVRISKIKVMLT